VIPKSVTFEVWRNRERDDGTIVREKIGEVRGFLFPISVTESVKEYGETVVVTARFYSLTDFTVQNDDILRHAPTDKRYAIVSIHDLPQSFFIKFYLELRGVEG